MNSYISFALYLRSSDTAESHLRHLYAKLAALAQRHIPLYAYTVGYIAAFHQRYTSGVVYLEQKAHNVM